MDCVPNGRCCPCGVMARTLILALAFPGTTMYSPAALPDGGTPGMTNWVDGAAVLASQLAVPPCDELSETSAATRPTLVRTSIAATVAPAASDDSDSVTVWCGGTVIPVSPSAWTRPASVMTPTFTLAGNASTFIRSSRICAAPPCWPGPTNHRSEPGSPQRTLARPAPVASSASRARAMVPFAVTDQPCRSWLAGCLLEAGLAAGGVSREGRPGGARLRGFWGGSCARARGGGTRWVSPGTGLAADAAMKATWPGPPPGTGGQARVAELTATRCAATWAGAFAGAVDAVSCAAPAIAPTASRTTPAGISWIGLMAGHRSPTGRASPRSSGLGLPRGPGRWPGWDRGSPGPGADGRPGGPRLVPWLVTWLAREGVVRASRAGRRAGRRGGAWGPPRWRARGRSTVRVRSRVRMRVRVRVRMRV